MYVFSEFVMCHNNIQSDKLIVALEYTISNRMI